MISILKMGIAIMNSFGSRVAVTIVLGASWLAFIVLYLAFFAENMDILQKAAVFVASGAIVIGVISALWAKWALQQPT